MRTSGWCDHSFANLGSRGGAGRGGAGEYQASHHGAHLISADVNLDRGSMNRMIRHFGRTEGHLIRSSVTMGLADVESHRPALIITSASGAWSAQRTLRSGRDL
jgi:hypothetical protein